MGIPQDADYVMSELVNAGPHREAEWIERIGASALIETLGAVITPERATRIKEVAGNRSYAIAPVVEGVLNTGNVSAIMRTAEALGLQPFHVIAHGAPFKTSARTSQGAHKWLDVELWPTAASCAAALRRKGYRIIALHPDETSEPLESVDFAKKTALVFGNELSGVSDEMLGEADGACRLPMSGFVRSYNVSVAAAMALHHASRAHEDSTGPSTGLTDEKKLLLTARFYYRAVENADDILQRKFS